jgi:hypothetical protein
MNGFWLEGVRNGPRFFPTIRQIVVEGVAGVKLGKPTALGTIDVPDSTRRLEVEALVEPAP